MFPRLALNRDGGGWQLSLLGRSRVRGTSSGGLRFFFHHVVYDNFNFEFQFVPLVSTSKLKTKENHLSQEFRRNGSYPEKIGC